MNNLALSYLLKKTFNKYPLDHSLNPNKIEKFIKLADPGVKDICSKIIKNTNHISFENFLIRLNICINELLNFVDIFKPIYIIIDIENYNDYKFKSSFWIFEYVKQYINFKSSMERKIILINNIDNKILKDNDTIIFIDDCIYSGTQMADTIYFMNNKRKLKLFFYILVPFISNNGKQKVIYSFNLKSNRRDYCKIIFSKKSFRPKSLNEVLDTKEISIIEKYYSKFQYLSDKYLIYFDHKLADTISTLTLFYMGIVPNQKNLNVLKQINIKDYSHYLYLLDIVPIINKCNKYKFKIDFYSPKCPAPPYKKNFNKFINLYKKDIDKYKSLSNIKLKSNSLKPIIKYKSL
jgi:hypothetical protein